MAHRVGTGIVLAHTTAVAKSPQVLKSVHTSGCSKTATTAVPASVVAGHHKVMKLLGEGGNKKVYLDHDVVPDREWRLRCSRPVALEEAA